MKGTRNLAAMAAFAIALAIASNVHATPITFYLTQGECIGNPCSSVPAPIQIAQAVSVTVTLTDSTHASVLFDAPGAGNITGGAASIKVSGFFQASTTRPGGMAGGVSPNFNCDNITGGSTADCAPQSPDQFGTFNAGTGATAVPNFIINLLALNGTTWANEASVLTPTTNFNSKYGQGFMAALNGSQFAGRIVPAPEPTTLSLIGLGLLGLGAMMHRRRNWDAKNLATARV